MKHLFTTFLLLASGALMAQPSGYYDAANGLTGDALKTALHNIIKNHTEYSYDDLRDFILADTDEDPNNPNNIILLYTGRSQAKSTFGGGANDWNREHVWAKSHGDFGTSPPCGTDAHHLRPTDASVNSSRGNLDFDNGGQQHSEATGCYYDNDSWEPRDEVKGDVARMIFYMAVRYEGGSGEPDLEVVDWVNTAPSPQHGKFSTLFAWHQQDPPDAFEMNRNEVIYSYQGNRNPFIDHPEYLILIYEPTNSTGNHEAENQFSLYPNPAVDFVKIAFAREVREPVMLTVHDLSGREMLKETIPTGETNLELDVSELPAGNYILTSTTDRTQQKSKLIVTH
ncbi:MAG: endonuclease [Bacteroidales bacterium]|nr:endonuclease [Bacteroidales bacterium]